MNGDVKKLTWSECGMQGVTTTGLCCGALLLGDGQVRVPIEPIRFSADQVTFDPELSGSYPTQGVDAFCSALHGYVTARRENKPSR
jgi:hypothetical protein